jgi:endonuclease/exonuclease/phosphatase family metal-dependent hydrolase
MAKSKHKFRFRLFLWINQFFVFLLLLTYLSPYTPPHLFWGLSVWGITYPLLLLINILFIVYWLLLVNKNVLYSLFAILIGFTTLSKHFKLSGNKETQSEKAVKLISFNVKNLSNNNEKYANKEVRTAIKTYLKKQEAQIICLQEFQTYPTKGVNTVKNFKSQLDMPFYAKARYTKHSRFKFVDLMLTYSKFPILQQEELRYKEKIYALIVDLKIQKDTIRLFNIHLESNHFGHNEYEIFSAGENKITDKTSGQVVGLLHKLARYSKIRNIQVNQLQEKIKNSPYPILLCGDFNDTPASYAYHKLALNKKDAFIEQGIGYGNTFNGKLPPMRIDYILCDTVFKVLSFNTGKINKSDHYPIISALDLSSKN